MTGTETLDEIVGKLDSFSQLNDIADSLGKNEQRVARHGQAQAGARVTAHTALRTGQVPGYDPETVSENPGELTQEQVEAGFNFIQAKEYHDAVNLFYNNRKEILTDLSDDAVEYLAKLEQLQENPLIKNFLALTENYKISQQAVEALSGEDASPRELLQRLDDDGRKQLIEAAILQEKKAIEKQYQTPGLQKLAYAAVESALLTGTAPKEFYIAGATYIANQVKAQKEAFEKQTKMNLRGAVTKTLDSMADGSTKDVSNALGLTTQAYQATRTAA